MYLGDGRGDLCPCTRLGPTDVILARTHYPDGKAASLLQLLAAESASIRAADGSSPMAALPPPPPLPAPAEQQSAGSGGLASTSAAATNGCSSSSSAAWTSGGKWPEGHTAGLVRQLAADAAQHLNPSGQAAAPQPALRPLVRSVDGGGGGQQAAAEGPEDAVAQRWDHQNPVSSQEDDIATLQVTAALSSKVLAAFHGLSTSALCVKSAEDLVRR